MRRCFFGGILLAALLAACLITDRTGRHGPLQVSAYLQQAEDAYLREDPQQGKVCRDQGRRIWLDSRPMLKLLHHGERLQEVDLLFSRLEAMETGSLQIQAGLCCEIRSRTAALGGRSPGTGR